jgi:hypothetical protein
LTSRHDGHSKNTGEGKNLIYFLPEGAEVRVFHIWNLLTEPNLIVVFHIAVSINYQAR